MFDFAYSYRATNTRGQDVLGVIYAPDIDMAYARIRQSALKARSVALDPKATVERWLSGGQMSRQELARFYKVLARRYKASRSVRETLENASAYVRDNAIREAAMLMGQRIQDGVSVSDAMLVAGFPQIHAMSIRAAEGSGNYGDTFARLSEDLDREARLAKGISSAMRMPKMLAVFMFVAMFGATYFLAPMPEKFMAEIGTRPEPLHEMYFAASHALHANLPLWGGLYLALPVALIALGRRVKPGRLLDAWGAWRTMSEKSDHGTCWTAFAMLYQAGISPAECATVVAGAARRDDTRTSFALLARLLMAGQPLSMSATRAGFPDFVVAGVTAAEESGGSLSLALQEFARELATDVEDATGAVQAGMQVAATVLGGLMMTFFIYLTLFPILTAAVARV